MPMSMTGFGRSRSKVGGHELTVEVRSVNHRYCDVRLVLPQRLNQHGSELERLIRRRVSRGRVDVHVSVKPIARYVGPRVDLQLARAYLDEYQRVAEALGLSNEIGLKTILEGPGVVMPPGGDADGAPYEAGLFAASEDALDDLLKMRKVEGAHLTAALREHLAAVANGVAGIRKQAPMVLTAKKVRLESRLAELIGNAGLDPARIAQEVALMVDRIDVVEELERLESHVEHAKGLMAIAGPGGRRLDFLAQEMLREVNTIGSKCSDSVVARTVVDMKAELERMREQIQNLE